MPSPCSYKAYHTLKALMELGDASAAEVAEKYNEGLGDSGNKPITGRNIAQYIYKRLIPAYAEVVGVRRPWRQHESQRGINVYRATGVGRDFVERYASRWGCEWL